MTPTPPLDDDAWIAVEETGDRAQAQRVAGRLRGAGIAVRTTGGPTGPLAVEVPLAELDEALAVLDELDGEGDAEGPAGGADGR